jgi:hypothetical protein
MTPIIKLQFDQELDKEMAWNFYGHKRGGCDFWVERALKYHPSLTDIESAENKRNF